MSIFWLIIGMAVGTFAWRYSFFLLYDHIRITDFQKRALRLVPPAVLSALLLPAILRSNGGLDFSLGNPRLLAAALSVIIAYKTKNVLATIIVGMATLFLIQALY